MVRTSQDSKRRGLALVGFIGGLLSLTVLGSILQRQELQTRHPDSIPTLPPADKKRIKKYKALFQRARERGRRREWSQVVVSIEPLCATDEACPPILRSCYAEAALRLGRPERYVALMRHRDTFAEMAGLALLGKPEECRKKAEKMVNLLDPGSASGVDANAAAWAAVLCSGPPPQPEKVIALAERGVAYPEHSDMTSGQVDNTPEFLNTLGIVLYRVGRDAEAVEHLRRSEALRSNAMNWPFLALAYHRLGNEAEARAWARRYREHLDETFSNVEPGRLEKMLFLRELDTELPAQ